MIARKNNGRMKKERQTTERNEKRKKLEKELKKKKGRMKARKKCERKNEGRKKIKVVFLSSLFLCHNAISFIELMLFLFLQNVEERRERRKKKDKNCYYDLNSGRCHANAKRDRDFLLAKSQGDPAECGFATTEVSFLLFGVCFSNIHLDLEDQ